MTYDLNHDISSDTELKQRALSKLRQRFQSITDALGHPIDPGILESVVLLNALGLHTTQSCEGHDDHLRHNSSEPRLSPWIEVYPHEPPTERWQEDDRLRASVEEEGHTYRFKTLELLTIFYADRKVPYDVMLGIDSIAYGFRLQSNGSETLPLIPDAERTEKIPLYQQEMKDFTSFLEHAFFNMALLISSA